MGLQILSTIEKNTPAEAHLCYLPHNRDGPQDAIVSNKQSLHDPTSKVSEAEKVNALPQSSETQVITLFSPLPLLDSMVEL